MWRRQKGQCRARCAADRVGDLRLDRPRIAADIAGLDWKGAAFGGDHRGLVEERGDAGSVDRRRHDEEPQILAQALLHVARERQAEIVIERALVEFAFVLGPFLARACSCDYRFASCCAQATSDGCRPCREFRSPQPRQPLPQPLV